MTSCTVLVCGGWYGGSGPLDHASARGGLPAPLLLCGSVFSLSWVFFSSSSHSGERAANASTASNRVDERVDDCGDGSSTCTLRGGERVGVRFELADQG